MKRLLLFLFIFPIAASASDLNDVVRDVADSKMAIITSINGREADVVYVGRAGSCESVSIMWTSHSIENFRVCAGEVNPRGTVSPAWDKDSGRPTFLSVVNNAIMYGHAKQMDSNGYLVSAQALNAVSHECKNVEVVISYNNDLVDREVINVCGK